VCHCDPAIDGEAISLLKFQKKISNNGEGMLKVEIFDVDKFG